MNPRPIDAANFTLSQRDSLTDADILLTGLQATARVVADQLRADRRRGLNTAAFVCGYPGSPLAGFDQTLRRMDKSGLDITHVDGLNEDLAATAVWGSQQDHLAPLAKHDGVIGVWYGKAPGFDRSCDVLRHANLHGAGTNGGVVLMVGDDPASKSSTMPSASEAGLIDLAIPVLYPGTVQEVLDFGRHAFELSRATGLYVAMKIVTAIADGFGIASVRADWDPVSRREWEFAGTNWSFRQRAKFFIPDTLELETELHARRLPAAARFISENRINHVEVSTDADTVGIVAAGRTYQEMRQALRELGLDDDELRRRGIRLLKVGALFPWTPDVAAEFARGLRTVIVVEEKRSLLERYLREQFYDLAERPAVLGKYDRDGSALFPPDGELLADRIRPLLHRALGLSTPTPRTKHLIPVASAAERIDASTRTAYFCSGCPHNRSTADLGVSPVGGGVGCHALVMWMDRGATSYTHMGGEGAQWIGRAPFVDTPHIIQNVGDGTYFHSASLVPRFAVAAGANITFRILYNGVIAMTGGQDPSGQQSVPDLCRSLLAEGVEKVVVVADDLDRYSSDMLAEIPDGVEVRHRDRLADTERELSLVKGVTVLIYDQACANELRRMRKRKLAPERKTRVVINEAVCEGCGDCGVKSTCLSVQPVDSLLGRKTQIHQASCNTDYSCLDGDCPSFVTVDVDVAPSATVRVEDLAIPGDFTEPSLPAVPADGFGIYTVGVGGTGLVTLNQVLATAAAFDGLYVSGLDQTGLSQKGGPVVSHLKLFTESTQTSQSITEQSTDAFIALDLLVANETRHRSRLSPQRTRALLSTSMVATAEMVLHTDKDFGAVDGIVSSLAGCVRNDALQTLDVVAIAERVFKDHMAANIIALGAAYQLGFLPVSSASLLRAIEVNGAAVERSRAAFNLGRLVVARPDDFATRFPEHRAGRMDPTPADASRRRVAGLVDAALGADARTEVGNFVALLAAELVEYQSVRHARRFLDALAPLAVRERTVSGHVGRVTRAAALHLFRLTAYKDEYEVARLHRKSEFHDELGRLVPKHRKMRYRLHPPILKAFGLKRKIALPPVVATPTFVTLAAMRRLRGTPLDPFGFASMRRLERKLITRYADDITLVSRELNGGNVDACLGILEAPAIIRGYEEVKLRSLEKFEVARSAAVAALSR
jgi:indolepyruvate ferredoxin oxidoreductase